MSGTSEDLIVGLFALSLLPLIALRLRRGLREGRLPIYRTSLERTESRSRFAVLMGLHVLSFVLIALVGADLLLDLGLRERL